MKKPTMSYKQPVTEINKQTKLNYFKTNTNKTKLFPYDEYYKGQKDKEERRSGDGENHWSGEESLEWYNGRFTRDTMNGAGEYRWRYDGPQGAFITYEGWFYANRMHGYGSMSYSDGRTFTGLFHNNIRWGPGIDSHAHLETDLGFWLGNQLVRLAWRPPVWNVVLDFMSNHIGRDTVEQYRVMLTCNLNAIDKTNSAIELLKQNGADPQLAVQIWTKLYSKHCTDLESQACHVGAFERECYGRKMKTLEEVTSIPEQNTKTSKEGLDIESKTYFAWNNNTNMLHMMKHCYQHEDQRDKNGVNLEKCLNGPRKHFREAGKHERSCRSLLMASYLGRIANVAQLVNEYNVHPDIADMQGNTALMYATSSDQANVIHFLMEAGANVNSYNDCCCTPLGVALMRFLCVQNDILPKSMVQALLPKSVEPLHKDDVIVEWHINRDVRQKEDFNKIKAVSSIKSVAIKSSKSLASKLLLSSPRLGARSKLKQQEDLEYRSNDSYCEDKMLYLNTKEEYCVEVHKTFAKSTANVPYLFAVDNILTVPNPSKQKKGAASSSRFPEIKSKKSITRSQSSVELLDLDDVEYLTKKPSAEELKTNKLSKIMLTINQLMADGADPRLVRCPQPALFTAVASMSPDLVTNVLRHGVDVNEAFAGGQNLTALEIALAYPLSYNNLGVIRALLQYGADTTHQVQSDQGPGPTLLHVIVNRKTEFVFEDEILRELIELLLEYNCNPLALFEGRSVVDIVMTEKLNFLDLFIKNPKTDLNGVINASNQTPLVKMFSPSYFFHLTVDRIYPIFNNLLLNGADPLIECQEEDERYENVFVYAHKIFGDIEKRVMHKLQSKSRMKSMSIMLTKKSSNIGKKESNNEHKTPIVAHKSCNEGNMFEYKRAIDLVTECARFIYIKWLQAKLMKELVAVIFRYKHRVWCMILKEIKQGRSYGKWLTPQRCLEIWDILETTKKKVYKDFRILKQLLYIVEFYNRKSKLTCSTTDISPIMTGAEKNMIEADVDCLFKEHRRVSVEAVSVEDDTTVWKGLCVKPELAEHADHKYKICFECALPLADLVVPCLLCNVISFCSLSCIEINVERVNCHPCSEYLRKKYNFSASTTTQ